MNEIPEEFKHMAEELVERGQLGALRKKMILQANTVTHQLEGFVKAGTGDRIVVRASGINRKLVREEFNKMIKEVRK